MFLNVYLWGHRIIRRKEMAAGARVCAHLDEEGDSRALELLRRTHESFGDVNL
jgi:hypothetical protein